MLDFIDVGSSKGGSIRYAQQRIGPNGYGIDIDPAKVKIAQEAGYDVRLQDIFEVDDKARWVTCLHTLEHLPSRLYAADLIRKATEIADNVYLVIPYFDSDSYLYDHGLRFFWSYWTGHTLHLTRLELHNILREIGKPFQIKAWGPILNSYHKDIVPLYAPIDILGHQQTFGEKKFINFTQSVYREVRAVIGTEFP